jgi:hypothetical protein
MSTTAVPGAAIRYSTAWPSVIQSETVYANAGELCSYASEPEPGEPGSLGFRSAVLRTLNRLQAVPLPFREESFEPVLDFGDHADPALFRELLTVDELPSGWRYEPGERERIEASVAEALSVLEEVDAAVARSLKTIVGALIFARREHFGGGSVSHLIGTIWLGPSPTWTSLDYAENLLHEYVHQCLFLDEMVNTIFSTTVPRMAEEDALVTSTILRRRRGYDKSFHSAFVAAVIMQLYRRLGREAPEHASLQPARLTAAELRERSQFLTPHGIELLDELDDVLAELGAEA